VGLTLALDLAWRGIEVLVLETRAAGEPPSVKCNHVSSRSMEIYRRLGIAGAIRAAGLPDEYPNDVVFRTRATGHELTRIPIPCRRDRYLRGRGPDTLWPTPEPPHRINQIYFEPVLFQHAARTPRVRILSRTQLVRLEPREDGVRAHARDLVHDRAVTIDCDYLVGCDGARSSVRRAIGAQLHGDELIQRVQSTSIRAPDLLDRITPPPAWMSYIYSPVRAGNLVAIDGREIWLVHNYLRPHEQDFDAVDRDACIRTLLGVGADFRYQVLTCEDWIGRRLVADRFRSGRVFLCGDAAHLWVPYAGYGMNAGIADAANLAWLLAARLAGWGAAGILDAYECERQPVTEQISRFTMGHALATIRERNALPPELEDDSAAGAAARARVGAAAYALHVQQFACAGLNYGYVYARSPLIIYDGEDAPPCTMADYTPSSVPGCRTPHAWLADGTSLYDALGPGYTLLRLDRTLDVQPLERAAERRAVPLAVLDVHLREAEPAFRHALILSRPDQHVAWRGARLPADCAALIERIRGAA